MGFSPLDLVPKLDGFSPIPLGIMAPFMAYQSATMAFAFGLNYEIGKRTIKSMSNEQFNSLDPTKIEEIQSEHHAVQIKTFIDATTNNPHFDKIQDQVLDEMVKLEYKKIEKMPELIAQIPWALIDGLYDRNETSVRNATPGTDTRRGTIQPIPVPTAAATPVPTPTSTPRPNPRAPTSGDTGKSPDGLLISRQNISNHMIELDRLQQELQSAQQVGRDTNNIRDTIKRRVELIFLARTAHKNRFNEWF